MIAPIYFALSVVTSPIVNEQRDVPRKRQRKIRIFGGPNTAA